MATGALNPVIDQLRRAVLLPNGAGLTDGQLLESFISRKDEGAFEVLMRRHGPMVLGVCRRVLRNPHDAEDAFQATFLVLVRKAGSIVPREMVANWLYGVAHRTALKARTTIARNRVRERQVTEMPEPKTAEPDHSWRDWRPLLDKELSCLPDKYRTPIVLCDLEGKAGKDASRQLGWPEGTVASRLSRGRSMLAKRLTRRGLAVSGGALAAALSPNAAIASVPTSLISSTVKAASLVAAGHVLTTGLVSAKVTALTEGMVKAMLLSKLKTTVLVLVMIGLAGTGFGGVFLRAAAKDQPVMQTRLNQPAHADENTPADQKAQDVARSDLEKLQGTWRVVSSQVGDERAAADEVERRRVTINGNLLIYDYGNEQKEKQEGTFKLNPKTKALDWSWIVEGKQVGVTMLAVYELKGDDLTICFGNDGLVRPRHFVIDKEDAVWLLGLKREKPEHRERQEDAAVMQQGRTGEADAVKKFADLQGTWTLVKMENGGQSLLEKSEKWQVVIEGDRMRFGGSKETQDLSKLVDVSKLPKTVTYAYEEKLTFFGIYKVKGDELYVCGDGVDTADEKNPEARRPKEFNSNKGLLLVFKRASPRELEAEKKAATQGQARLIFDLILKGFCAYQDAKAPKEPPPPPPSAPHPQKVAIRRSESPFCVFHCPSAP